MNTIIKKYTPALLIALFIISLSSCEKEIDVDLRSAPPQIVIEGIVKEGLPATVRLSQTLDFSNNDGYPNLSNAIVTISDDLGNSEILKQDANGWYTAKGIKGEIGRTYNMSVMYDGQEYTSTSQMPPHVSLDSVTIKKVPAIDNPFPVLHFQDPIGEANQYYRTRLFINGKQHPDVTEFAVTTEFTDGTPYDWELMVFTNNSDVNPIANGDELTFEFQCIDRGTFKFFDSLINNIGTPTNPISNITNGALGYFSACTTEQVTIIAEWTE